MKAINAYLNFDGTCREAMEFYRRCLGGELRFTTVGEVQSGAPDAAKDRIIHASLTKGPSALMASDAMPGAPYRPGNNISIAVNCETAQEIEALFSAFSATGKVMMPLADAFWGGRFGMLTDQFGIQWLFNFEKAGAGA